MRNPLSARYANKVLYGHLHSKDLRPKSPCLLPLPNPIPVSSSKAIWKENYPQQT